LTQYLRFKNLNFDTYKKKLFTHLAVALLLSAVITYFYTLWINTFAWQYVLLLFSGVFTIITNLDYLITFVKFNVKQSASVMSHLGFGLMIIGILASGLNKRWISNNTFAMQGVLEKEQLKKNILLLRNESMMMNDYEVKYAKDSMYQHTRTFSVDYIQRDTSDKVINQFSLTPYVLYDKGFSKIASTNPATKHYWNKDIFTHIASLPPSEMDAKIAKEVEDTLRYKIYDLAVGDTFTTRNFKGIINEISDKPVVSGFELKGKDFGLGAKMTIVDLNSDKKYEIEPKVVVKDGVVYSIADNVNTLSLKLKIDNDFLIALENGARKTTSVDKKVKLNETIKLNNHTYTVTSINRIDKHPQMVQGDLGVIIDIKDENGKTFTPGIIIRENTLIPMAPIALDDKTNIIMTSIDPKDESFQLKFADKVNRSTKLPVSIADNAPPSNFIVLEAIEFPGINYFWIGCSMMMFGLTLALFVRLKAKYFSLHL
jgi:cytochrome c-type biogenesis protein CcmF